MSSYTCIWQKCFHHGDNTILNLLVASSNRDWLILISFLVISILLDRIVYSFLLHWNKGIIIFFIFQSNDWQEATIYEITSWHFKEDLPAETNAILELVKFIMQGPKVDSENKITVLSRLTLLWSVIVTHKHTLLLQRMLTKYKCPVLTLCWC